MAARVRIATASAHRASSTSPSLEDMCLGHTVADVMVVPGSIDIVMGEVDR
jgi:NADH-quinone oxidoreductase subunit D